MFKNFWKMVYKNDQSMPQKDHFCTFGKILVLFENFSSLPHVPPVLTYPNSHHVTIARFSGTISTIRAFDREETGAYRLEVLARPATGSRLEPSITVVEVTVQV